MARYGAGIFMVCLFVLTFFCGKGSAASFEDLSVFAAASLQESLTAAAKLFEAENSIKVRFNFASSGTIARQITAGAPAAVFVSAAPKWTTELTGKGLLKGEHTLVQNRLVLIAAKDTPKVKIDFSKGFDFAAAFKGKLSIGIPTTVPAGTYAQQSLTKLGWWDNIESRLIESKDVREAMRVVEMGGAELGIVYKTDAMASQAVQVIGEFPAETHAPIVYTIGLVKGGGATAQNFINFLSAEKALAIFVKYGFSPAPLKE